MNRKLFAAGLSATVVLAVTASSASAVIIGGSGQSSQQGVNGSQLSNAATATGNVIDLGPTSSAPSSASQNATNLELSGQSVGSDTPGPAAADTYISPTNIGPSQTNEQGLNALQGSENSAIGTQNLTNVQGNAQIIGGDLACLAGGCAASTIIGTPEQANDQALNYQQAADGGVTAGDSYLLPNVSFNGLVGSTSQNTLDLDLNDQMIIS